MIQYLIVSNQGIFRRNDSTVQGFSTRATRWLSQLKTPCWRWDVSFKTCWRVERTGMLKENAPSKNDELILPVNTFLINKISCWVLRAANELRLKCLSKSGYKRDDDCRREWAFSHIKNLCWTLSIRSVWTAAAPPQMTLQYSSTFTCFECSRLDCASPVVFSLNSWTKHWEESNINSPLHI